MLYQTISVGPISRSPNGDNKGVDTQCQHLNRSSSSSSSSTFFFEDVGASLYHFGGGPDNFGLLPLLLGVEEHLPNVGDVCPFFNQRTEKLLIGL